MPKSLVAAYGGAVLLAMSCGGCSSTDRLEPADRPLQLNHVPLSYHSRAVRTEIEINPAEWSAIVAEFQPPPPTAQAERLAIRRSIAKLEQIAGRQTPTFRDWRVDDINPAGAGSMDCIDEAINTTVYLRLLEEQGLIRRHEVMEKAFRGPFQLDTHYAGQIRDSATGDLYVVDSWFLANGWPPYVQKTRDWLSKLPWPTDENPDTYDEASLDTARAYWPPTD